jgi:hypothetical protein
MIALLVILKMEKFVIYVIINVLIAPYRLVIVQIVLMGKFYSIFK